MAASHSSLLRKWFGNSPGAVAARKAISQHRLEVESLEQRLVPAVVFKASFGAETVAVGALQHALQSPPVYLVFWGSYWSTAAGAQYKSTLVNTAKAFIGSGAFDGLKQYGGDGKASFGGSWTDPTDPPASASVTSAKVQAVIQKAIDDPTSPLPDPALAAHKPVYFVVTPPTPANQGGDGWNGGGVYTHNGANTGITMGLLKTLPGNADNFSVLVSHELIEAMSNDSGIQQPASLPANLKGDHQISDNEPNAQYLERFANGALGQAYWSKKDANYLMTDGNSQRINVNPIWTLNAAKTVATLHGFDLIVNGDQRANFNDNIILDTSDAGGVKITLNGETTLFDLGQIKSITINAGKGADTIEVRATPAGVKTTVNGGDGDDTMRVGAPGQLFSALHTLSYIQGAVLLDGGNGKDSVVINDNDIFDTSRTYTVQFSSLSRPGAANIAYDHVGSVTVNAGNGDDAFIVKDHAFYLPMFLNGGGGHDSVTGPNRDETWKITGTDTGVFDAQIHFSGVEALHGGAAKDTFRFLPGGSLSDSATGGGGIDTLDYSAQAVPVSIVLASNHATGMANAFTSIEKFVGSSSSADKITGNLFGETWMLDSGYSLSNGTITASSFEKLVGGPSKDTLVGKPNVNTFAITGADTGVLDTKLSYTGIENLRGGAGTELFKFSPAGSVSGSIDGGAGIDTLDFSARATAVNVNLTTGSATGVQEGVLHVENVFGGAGDDTLTGDSHNNILKGNGGNDKLTGLAGGNILIGDAGNDSLFGGDGRDILIGGTGKDLLSGAAGEDIVIGGITVYDNNNLFALLAMSNEWQDTNQTYAQRYANLHVTGVNGVYRLNAKTVMADSDIDQLFGNAGDDWFFASPNQDTTDRGPASFGGLEKLN